MGKFINVNTKGGTVLHRLIEGFQANYTEVAAHIQLQRN